MRAYEDKLLGKIDEGFWRERSAAWQAELAGINGELQSIGNAPSYRSCFGSPPNLSGGTRKLRQRNYALRIGREAAELPIRKNR